MNSETTIQAGERTQIHSSAPDSLDMLQGIVASLVSGELAVVRKAFPHSYGMPVMINHEATSYLLSEVRAAIAKAKGIA